MGIAPPRPRRAVALPRLRRDRASADGAERTLASPLALRRPRGRVAYGLLLAALLLATLSTILPLYWLFSGGLKQSAEIYRTPPSLIPERPQWDNYRVAWDHLRYARYFTNTALIALGSWAAQLVVAATAAYALSKLRPAGGRVVLFLFLSTLMVPSEAYLIPQYLTVLDVPVLHIRLVDTWWAIWLRAAVSAFNIYLLKSFFDEIPRDLTDAAVLDGANAWQVFVQIVLPLSKPVLSVVSIFAVIGTWKDFFWPFLVLTSPDLQPITVALYRLADNEPLNLIVAALAIASLPPLALFLLFQRQIIAGITFSGIKG
ncbi:MAG: ABC transporter, permease protein 2 (cluster 1, maltose/g3p/polyamine/iron) [uncultured Thermomicrobiales bacterium]|uniref:ABC transporter, permease protein 2 (Cluster 1, maltose/g3p/polyamine/iron) n=1 Tax=uncultured Thermomicrobiales bacterium TaxID=1645740 RepID=A0A6J4UMU6_9BACT|nr:MAG: ABC transporter, permease protein 2 (cluster 1, maltose/g3p/polyamine/iron) [uncultured Thermomicrobiales bacterium]